MDPWADKKVFAKAKTIPSEIVLCDEDGNPIDGDDTVVIPIDWYMKLHIAERSIKWKQSVETTINRILMQAVKDKIKHDFPDGVPDIKD